MTNLFFIIWMVCIISVALLERSVMYKIKNYNIELYRELVGDSGGSWIEAGGWYLPSHIPISWRLHKAVIGRNDPEIISSNFRLKYIAFVVLFVISFFCFIFTGIASFVGRLG